jgi:hypothetical protein
VTPAKLGVLSITARAHPLRRGESGFNRVSAPNPAIASKTVIATTELIKPTGVLFLPAGVVLVYIGYALVTNHRGIRDRKLENDDLAGDLVTRGRWTHVSLKRLGWLTLCLGFVYLLVGFGEA